MDTTNTIALLLGLYFVAAGTGLLVDRDMFSTAMRELADHPMLGYLGGLLAFLIGGAILAVHNDWSSPLAGFVSLVGWFAIAEGMLMLAFRKWFLGLFTRLAISPRVIALFGGGTLAVGIVIVWAAMAS